MALETKKCRERASRNSMNNERRFASTDHFDRDLYTSSQTGERALNEAILGAEISESYEEYLDIFDAFYAENIELRGRAKITLHF
jgi:hypothetical protein